MQKKFLMAKLMRGPEEFPDAVGLLITLKTPDGKEFILIMDPLSQVYAKAY